jgi:hypothetical protein
VYASRNRKKIETSKTRWAPRESPANLITGFEIIGLVEKPELSELRDSLHLSESLLDSNTRGWVPFTHSTHSSNTHEYSSSSNTKDKVGDGVAPPSCRQSLSHHIEQKQLIYKHLFKGGGQDSTSLKDTQQAFSLD